MRRSGLLVHLTSLPSLWGVGDLGKEARRLADSMAKTGIGVWQMLPLNETASVFCHSPYSPVSAFGGNRVFISPEVLLEEGRILEKELPEPLPQGQAQFDEALSVREKLIRLSYDRGKKDGEFSDFKIRSRGWLSDYCLFSALKDKFKGLPWDSWPDPYKFRDKKTLEDFSDQEAEKLDVLAFGQFLFYHQEMALRNYCKALDISILGDIPIYVIHDGPDVWGNQELFQLDGNLKPKAIAGVPPDYFSENGQLWGNPLYNWEAHEKTGFKWWLDRLSQGLTLYDELRIDHFRGLVGYWSVPSGEETARNGRWMEVPYRAFFKALKYRFPSMPFLAENLGVITADVKGVMEELGLPGMAVLQFAFDGDMGKGPYSPHNHSKSMAVYTGTHDNDTCLGWYGSAPEWTKHNLEEYLGHAVDRDNVTDTMIRMALGSVADLAVIPIQDVLGLGSEGRFNAPSTTGRNWVWRAPRNYLETRKFEAFGKLLSLYGRDMRQQKKGEI